jgi:hypothetical protein
MTSIASVMEGSLSILKTIDSKHKLIENTNMILSVNLNSLSQQLFHSLEIASVTDSEKLCLQQRSHQKQIHTATVGSHTDKANKWRIEKSKKSP